MTSISNEILGPSFEPFKNLHKLHTHDKLNDQFPLSGFREIWTLIPILQPSQTAVPRTKPVLLGANRYFLYRKKCSQSRFASKINSLSYYDQAANITKKQNFMKKLN